MTSAQPHRVISLLIQEHLAQVHAVDETLSPDQQTGIDINTITTEAQASAYIQKVMARLHPAGPR
jgi:hypothetical protein